MESKWNQVINSHQGKVDARLESTAEKVKTEIEKEEQSFRMVNKADDVYIDDHQQHPPESPMYLPQYNKSYSLKSQHNNKMEKRYKYNPKPLGRKTNRKFVPELAKTEEYWQKRIKNNVAARKSREDRRRKEIEMLGKKSQFEKENVQLRLFIEKIQSENQYLLYEINFLREGKGYQKF